MNLGNTRVKVSWLTAYGGGASKVEPALPKQLTKNLTSSFEEKHEYIFFNSWHWAATENITMTQVAGGIHNTINI